MFLLYVPYFAQRPIFEHSVSGVGNLPSHVSITCLRFHRMQDRNSRQENVYRNNHQTYRRLIQIFLKH